MTAVNAPFSPEIATLRAPFPDPIARILARIGSRKRKCYVQRDCPRPMTLYSYWDGGSRDQFRAWNARGEAIMLPINGSAFETRTIREWIPNAGDVLVRFGVVAGKEATPSITFFEG